IAWSPNKMYLNLLIQDTKTLYLVANLINGNMRTPKIEALHRLIDWLNSRPDSLEITAPEGGPSILFGRALRGA
ncbi:MAG: hypothetical protein JW922_08905, partial [Paludibacteraceae bacterium]|nr:hypothetical protein [Paludibacteraceae bacterium]